MSESFVDVRLYITVRPTLEYRIPEVGNHAIAVMVGDEDDYTFTSVTCTNDSHILPDDPSVQFLCNLCMSVCSMTEEYLRQLEMEWGGCMTRIHSGLRSELDPIRVRLKQLQSLKKKYAPVTNKQVEQEFRNEMNKLNAEMNNILNRYRSATVPIIQRNQELICSSENLRTEFGNMYGSVETVLLMQIKKMFESEMRKIEFNISQTFDKRLRQLSMRPIV